MLIGINSWILQDGNYKDFEKGQTRKFALEYAPATKLRKSTKQVKECTPLGEGHYRVNAQVVYMETEVHPCTYVSTKNGKRVERKDTREETIVVLDLGEIMVYDEPVDKKPYEKGGFVEGEIWVGIDPFFYKDGYCKRPGMPALTYTWTIEKIEMLLAPYILERVDPRGTKCYKRDRSKVAYRELEQTQMWEDDDGRAEYLLTCINKQ
jgi:hypothetical protein